MRPGLESSQAEFTDSAYLAAREPGKCSLLRMPETAAPPPPPQLESHSGSDSFKYPLKGLQLTPRGLGTCTSQCAQRANGRDHPLCG